MWCNYLYLFLLYVTLIDVNNKNVNAQTRNFSNNAPCPGECVCFRRNVRCMRLELSEIPKVPLQATLL